MTAGEPEEIYVLARDKDESSRLDQQHNFLVELVGNYLIHPSIPRDGISNVADIGTGTGVWLKDVSEQLKSSGAKTPGHYHGFDISPAQFPSNPGELEFSVQDALKPFPKEHIGRYDLVHVRFLILALKAADYRTVVQNLTSLLRPGGYIQWLELDPLTADLKNPGNDPVFSEIKQLIRRALNHLGLSVEPPAAIYRECEAVGLKNVTLETHNIAPREPFRQKISQRWLARAMKGILPGFMVRSGQAETKKAADQATDALLRRYDVECDNGAIAALDIKMIIAQKA